MAEINPLKTERHFKVTTLKEIETFGVVVLLVLVREFQVLMRRGPIKLIFGPGAVLRFQNSSSDQPALVRGSLVFASFSRISVCLNEFKSFNLITVI